MQVSHSQLAIFRRCPREWRYRYVDKRISKTVPKALATGKSIHEALAAYHKNEPWDLVDPAQRAMLHGYAARWVDCPEHVTQTDVPFTFSIEGVDVVGEIDAVGDGFMLEHKTTSEDITPGSIYWRKIFYVDAQVSTYLHAARALGIERVIYDVLRKPALRIKQRETPDQFYGRILEDIASRPDHYYQRATIVRLDAERDDYIKDVTGTVRLIQLGEYPRNVDSCIRWGRECEYFGVCTGEVQLSDDERFENK